MTDTPSLSTQPSDAMEIAATTQPGDELLALQSLIERHGTRADQLREQVKAHQDSLRSLLENDTDLQQAEEQAKKLTDATKTRKKTLTQSPEYRAHQAKVTELRDELKEIEETLNSHLLHFFQITGVKAVDTSEGQREFKINARLLPKKKDME